MKVLEDRPDVAWKDLTLSALDPVSATGDRIESLGRNFPHLEYVALRVVSISNDKSRTSVLLAE